jgi:hypothetical protein
MTAIGDPTAFTIRGVHLDATTHLIHRHINRENHIMAKVYGIVTGMGSQDRPVLGGFRRQAFRREGERNQFLRACSLKENYEPAQTIPLNGKKVSAIRSLFLSASSWLRRRHQK